MTVILEKKIQAAGQSIVVQGVYKEYRTANGQLPVLRDIDLTIEAGEFVALVGPSGCGKSTLPKIIAGLESWNRGSVTVGGDLPQEGRRDIGFMLQHSVLMPWLNVEGNVQLFFKIAGSGDPHGRVAQLLDLVGIAHTAKLNPWELSGGMQQRVALARALALEPGVMLMDEPFSALDEFKREHLNIEVAHMSDSFRKTTILVTHNISEAVLMSDRIVALDWVDITPGKYSNVPGACLATTQEVLTDADGLAAAKGLTTGWVDGKYFSLDNAEKSLAIVCEQIESACVNRLAAEALFSEALNFITPPEGQRPGELHAASWQSVVEILAASGTVARVPPPAACA